MADSHVCIGPTCVSHTLVCSAFAPGAEERGRDEADVAQSAQNTDSHVWFWKKILGCTIWKTSRKRLEVAAVVCIRDAEGLKRGSGGNDGRKKTERALGFLVLDRFGFWSSSLPLPLCPVLLWLCFLF